MAATSRGFFTGGIADSEVLSEIVEKVSKETECVCDRKVDTVLVAKVGNRKLLLDSFDQ